MNHEPHTAGTNNKSLSIRRFVDNVPAELGIEVLAGADGLETKFINSERIQKLGLALSGFPDYIHLGRIQMFGKSELSYLNSLDDPSRTEAIENIRADSVSCILVTKALEPPKELVDMCERSSVPLLRTPAVSSKAIGVITGLLNEQLAAEITIHGVLMEMFGLGVLVLGESGIGKSECALDLISRHHRLVADDSIRVKRVGQRLEGEAVGQVGRCDVDRTRVPGVAHAARQQQHGGERAEAKGWVHDSGPRGRSPRPT